jgi:hypothetical protein
MKKKKTNQNTYLDLLIQRNIIISTAASLRLANIQVTDEEVEKIYKKISAGKATRYKLIK